MILIKSFLKIAKRILITLVILILAGCAVYHFAYPYVAPIVFDYLVDRNAEMFVQLEESLETTLEPAQEDTEEPALVPGGEQTADDTPEETPAVVSPDATPSPTATPKKPNTEIQTVHTTMGDFTGAHLVRALKNISPADKTRIISICQQAVSMSDMMTVSQILMSDGLSVDQQKYIENYLRDNLSVPAKREILTILQKY